MKKYIKPEVFIEKFELNQHIADCAWELTNSNKDNCYAEPDSQLLEGMPTLFMSENNGCMLIAGEYNDFCYNNGLDSPNVFAS